jgi:hypothetical protein
MNVTETSHGRVLAYLTQQELELLQGCLSETLESFSDCSVKDRIGFGTEEVKALLRQIGDGIEMIKHGTEPGAFGQLRPKQPTRK